VAVAVLAGGASVFLGGTALAEHGYHGDSAGAGGHNGGANANCLVPVGVSAGVVGQGDDVRQCNAAGGGAGNGPTGAGY
jgi:hypothetical protein